MRTSTCSRSTTVSRSGAPTRTSSSRPPIAWWATSDGGTGESAASRPEDHGRTTSLNAVRGVVAAGHPVTAQAGADVLRAGGNAVDAAVACVLMSFVTEYPLTGPGAGGFMLVHTPGGEDHLLDFFVAAPGKGLARLEPAALEPIDVEFTPEAVQRFNIGPSSCGVYGTTLGLAEALARFGRSSLAELVGAPASAAREGVVLTPIQAYLVRILGPIVASQPEGQAIYAP